MKYYQTNISFDSNHIIVLLSSSVNINRLLKIVLVLTKIRVNLSVFPSVLVNNPDLVFFLNRFMTSFKYRYTTVVFIYLIKMHHKFLFTYMLYFLNDLRVQIFSYIIYVNNTAVFTENVDWNRSTSFHYVKISCLLHVSRSQ